ncbi:hypothetical protein QAD02_021555 [Eretmocerus hayati]|uniref:Uncharacterized protein n=1 Tax=Eretmocerus hayati TaxID=131215 RepID=A0ACC2PQS3_9HYME|nr:hypothetical protein QAD02_021555 [Eretmocerus hayati]
MRKKNKNVDDEDNEDVSDDEGFLTQNNDYYLRNFGESLARICSEFLCWTNVTNGIFGNTQIEKKTSGRVESSIGIVKGKVSPNGKPIRLDGFFVRHSRQLEAEVLMGRSDMSNFIKSVAGLKKVTKVKSKEIVQNCFPYDNCYRLTDRWKKKINEDDIERDEFDDQVDLHSELKDHGPASCHVGPPDDHPYTSTKAKSYGRERDSFAVFEDEIVLSSSSKMHKSGVCVPDMIDALQRDTPRTQVEGTIPNDEISEDKLFHKEQGTKSVKCIGNDFMKLGSSKKLQTRVFSARTYSAKANPKQLCTDSFVEELRIFDCDDKNLKKNHEESSSKFRRPKSTA